MFTTWMQPFHLRVPHTHNTRRFSVIVTLHSPRRSSSPWSNVCRDFLAPPIAFRRITCSNGVECVSLVARRRTPHRIRSFIHILQALSQYQYSFFAFDWIRVLLPPDTCATKRTQNRLLLGESIFEKKKNDSSIDFFPESGISELIFCWYTDSKSRADLMLDGRRRRQ